MGKLRKILIGILAVCMTVCAGLALSACEDDYPNYKNPTGGTILPGEEQNDENRYTAGSDLATSKSTFLKTANARSAEFRETEKWCFTPLPTTTKSK